MTMLPVWLDVMMWLLGNLTDNVVSVVKFLIYGRYVVGKYMPVLPVSTIAG